MPSDAQSTRGVTVLLRPSCGCFGRIGDQRVTARTVAAVVIAALAVFILGNAAQTPKVARPAAGAAGWARDLGPVELTVVVPSTPAELGAWLIPLVEAGADVIHASQRRFWEPEFPELDGEKGLNFAGWVKRVTGAATISVGSVGLSGEFFGAFAGQGSEATPLDQLVERMEREEFDLIAVGRALISDPAWVNKVREGESLTGFDAKDLAVLA